MKKILLVEDHKDVRENTADILELAGYEVIPAEDGNTAITKANRFMPDIVLCDIMMPGLNGYGVFEKLNQDEKTAGIPFIFLTAKSEKTDIRKGMNLGADDYLTKPFEENELLDAVACRLRKNDFLRKQFSNSIEGVNQFFQDASEYLNIVHISKDYRYKTYKKKEIVFSEEDVAHSLYYVKNGAIKTYKSTEAGKELVTGIHKQGDFMGQLGLLSERGVYSETATVLEDAEVYAIPKADFKKFLHTRREVSEKFIGLISKNLAKAQEQLVDMAYASVRKRISKTLLTLSEKGSTDNAQEQGIDIAREDLANIIGTATETAIRTLTNFREEGLIAMGKARRIIILDKGRLQQLADFG